MAQWVYKTTRARATYADAHDLAVRDHFLCRSVYTRDGSAAGAHEVEVVGEIAAGDVIHYYYRTPEGTIRAFGSFRVVDASSYPDAFEPCAGHGTVVQVRQTERNMRMLRRLRRGYRPDPKLAVFTGWALEKLPPDCGTPGFDQAKMFPSLTTNLWRYPDPTLPQARATTQATG